MTDGLMKEKEAEFYDYTIAAHPGLRIMYSLQKKYYPLLAAVVSKLSDRESRILDLGCGAGTLAHLLWDNGFLNYTGIDFSKGVLGVAISWQTGYTFLQRDLREPDSFEDVEYDVVVSTEFVEHVHDDLEILGRVRSGTPVILSSTNAPGREHVRYFETKESIHSRYSLVLDIHNITILKGSFVEGWGWQKFYVVEGVAL